MKNSPLITQLSMTEELSSFVYGTTADKQMTPARVAWMLEETALQRGWPEDHFFGSELDLIGRFQVSREGFREAVRMVEARGSMEMRRGPKGGLYLARPSLYRGASLLATYVLAVGTTDLELAQSRQVAESVFASLPRQGLVVSLFRLTLDILNAADAAHLKRASRGMAIAHRLLRSHRPIPKEGASLGSEAALVEQFGCGRSTMRQALRILADLGFLHVRRGRGGGFSLRIPSAIGVVRQLFALLASHGQQLDDIVPQTWILNLVNLRLAALKMGAMSASARTERCVAMVSHFRGAQEPMRWALLQESIAQSAGDALTSKLQSSLVGYQLRLARPTVNYHQLDRDLRALEIAIVGALGDGDIREAEINLHKAQNSISELLSCPGL